MKARSFAHARRETASGFTLVELMIAVVIVALLASIALPSFMDSIRKSRRSEAFAALSAVQQAQERWRGNQGSYASALSDLGQTSPTKPGAYYDVAFEGTATATGYRVTATAVPGKSQAADGNCFRLRVRMDGGNIFYGSAAAAGDFDEGSNNRCWAR